MGSTRGQPQIIKIEKILNCVVYEKFVNEFKRTLKKYPNKQVSDIVKHLFHGSLTDPQLIYASENGLDTRFSRSGGVFGEGIYFANTSAYSHNYSYR